MASSHTRPPFLASRPLALGGPFIPVDGLPAAGDLPDVTIVGVPLDLTESFRPGTADAARVIRLISDSIEEYSPILDRDLATMSLGDAGDIDLTGLPMAEALHRIEAAVRSHGRNTLPVLFGGEHTLTLGSVKGALDLYPDLRILQIDAHLDLITRYLGDDICHATVFRRIAEILGPERIAQVGVRSGTAEEWRFARTMLSSSHDLHLSPQVRDELGKYPLYVSLDIDVLDPSAAPGTGCPEPGGPTYRELQTFLHSLAGLNVVMFDVVEVLPSIDPAGLAAVSAAKLARDAMLMWAGNHRSGPSRNQEPLSAQ